MSKRVLIISDTHGKNDDVKAVIEQVGHIDMLIHLGDIERGVDYIKSLVDCPVHMVSGNNDYNLHLDTQEVIEFQGYRIFITHGHHFYVNSGLLRLELFAKENLFDVVMFGHTHVPHFSRGEGVVLLNPGSLSYPRQESRKHTFAIMEVDDNGGLHFSDGELKSSLRSVYNGFY